MAYFPFFADMDNLRGLIVGGGNVAKRKINKLLPYGPEITVIAPEIDEEILKKSNIKIYRRKFLETDLNSFDFVIAATNNRNVNSFIAAICKENKIPVNVADSKEESSFIFPALIKNGLLSIGISTEGVSPTASVYLKEKFEEVIPDNFTDILDFLCSIRDKIINSESLKNKKTSILRELFFACVRAGRPLTEKETLYVIDEESTDGNK